MYTGISIAIPTGTDRDNCRVCIGGGNKSLRFVKRGLRTFSRNFNLRHMSIMSTSTNLAVLGWLNKYTQIKKLDITRTLPEGAYLDNILNFISTNTTIDNLNIESFISQGYDGDGLNEYAGPNKWVTFIKLLSRNILITSLMITGSISYPAEVANYIANNTTLRSLDIRLDDLEVDGILASALYANTHLTQISIFATPTHRFAQPSGSTGHAEKYILDLIEKTKTLRSLTVTNNEPNTFHSDKFAKSLVKNTTLNYVQLNMWFKGTFNKFVADIDSNITITRLLQYSNQCFSESTANDAVEIFQARNRQILWSKVRGELLEFTLIFYKLPPYVILEIFDWLPHMQLVKHYIKIQLICAMKRSISALKN